MSMNEEEQRKAPTATTNQPIQQAKIDYTKPYRSIHAEKNVGQTAKKAEPDQATIDALLQMTRFEQAQRDKASGTSISHWWNPAEWLTASSSARKSALVKAAIIIGISIVLSLGLDYLVSHAGISK